MASVDGAQLNAGLERIAKVIARAGVCSRREAEALIEDGRVRVNGTVIKSPALDVASTDKVEVDGTLLPAREAPRLWRYHKPKGRVTTHKDPEGRATVFEALPDNLPRVVSVGRLDFNTEGLLLLTNDGELARHMELPSTGWARRYRVRAYGTIEQAALDALSGGLTIEGVNYGPIEASVERDQGDNVWIALLIREGKNREVRRIMEHLGLTVNRLIRVSFGPFTLGDLEPGQVEEVKTRMLQDQLGPRLTRQLGVKREPLREERSLGPKRDKPTYLRRKSTPENQRPMIEAGPDREPRQRRIVPWDGASGEPVRVETIVEKPPRRAPRDDGDRPARSSEGRGERDGGRERGAPRPDFTRDRPRSASPARKAFGDNSSRDGARPARAERAPFVRDREREGRPESRENRDSFGPPTGGSRDGRRERTFGARPPRPSRDNEASERPNGPAFRRDRRPDADEKDFRPKPSSYRDRAAGSDRDPAAKPDGWTPRISAPEGNDNPATERQSERGSPATRSWTGKPPRREGETSTRSSTGRDGAFRPRPSGDKPFRPPVRSGEGKFERRSDGDRPAPRSGARDFQDRPRRQDGDRPSSQAGRRTANEPGASAREGLRKPFVKREASNRSGYDSRKGFQRIESDGPRGARPNRDRDASPRSSESGTRSEPRKHDKPRFGPSANAEGGYARKEPSNDRNSSPRRDSEPGRTRAPAREGRPQDRMNGVRSGEGGYRGRSSTGASDGLRKSWGSASNRTASGTHDRPRPSGDRDRSKPGANRAGKPFIARDRPRGADSASRPRHAPRKKPEGETDDA